MPEYRIDDLARAAGTTTRNVRAYQDRGLLPPPRRQGRIGVYDDGHLARLRLIASMLNRGYATAQIAELIAAWEQNKDITDVLGVEEAVTSPWVEETPLQIDTSALEEMVGAELLGRLAALDLITTDGASSTIASPQLLNVFMELLTFGYTPAQAVELNEQITPAIDEVARRMVEAAAERIVGEHGATWVPDGAELTALSETLNRMRRLAVASVQVNFARSMERHVAAVLGEHIHRVISAGVPVTGDGAA
ncbi:MerR family transcriptional regulator [Jatrophihabitans sp.]|uniref:MerR family transcriptional regulator n=1 Tax=Jatrophihabitans sp. TaxID=1932789 RepID=UPI0030C6C1D8|nr:MerR family transcription regulator [Jatrophihabitans sp.]